MKEGIASGEFEKCKDNPLAMERLYRQDKRGFSDFIATRAAQAKENGETDHQELRLLAWWDARINYVDQNDLKGIKTALLLGLICWFPIRIILGNPDSERLALMYLPSIFFATWGSFLLVQNMRWKRIGILIASTIGLAAYFTVLGKSFVSQSIGQANVHGFAALWLLVYFLKKSSWQEMSKNDLRFIEASGETICWTSLLIAAWSLLSIIAIMLFGSIGIDISEVYMLNLGSLGMVLAPFLATHLAERYADFRISNILAHIILPFASLVLVLYVGVSLISGRRPYEDRNVFILGNAVLLAMIALLFFGTLHRKISTWTSTMIILSTTVALAFDFFMLSATIYRIIHFGLTPNKVAVFGMNLLVAAHLIWIFIQGKVRLNFSKLQSIEHSIGTFMPVYLGWCLFVIFVLPALFAYA